MKYFQTLDDLFDFIRTLPVEITLDQVKKWIEEIPPIAVESN